MFVMLEEKPQASLYHTPLVHQSFFWSQVKERQGYDSLSFDLKVRKEDFDGSTSSAYLLDDILLLMIPISRDKRIAYAPYGPLLSPSSEELMGPFLEELSENLRPHLGKDTVMVRYDLPWRRPWEDELESPDLMEIRMNWSTEGKHIRKSVSDQLPPDTMVVDLSGDEAAILENMAPKTRYNIRLALRHGVTVREGSEEDLPIFLSLYEETSRRQGIVNHDASFFRSFYSAKDSDAGFRLLIAELDGVPLSSMFLTYSDRRATYLFGASSSERRDSMSTYALQWNAILLAKKLGCTSYDLFGVPPDDREDHPMHGLYRFKKGFGGSMVHRLGCWEYQYDTETADTLRSYELVDKGYHLR